MGALLKALSPISAYRARKDGLWDELKDRIDGALLMADLDEFAIWLEYHELDVPGGWVEPLEEMIARKREELRAEDIGEILRDRFDFT